MKISEENPENCAEMFLGRNFARKIQPDCRYTMAEYYRILKDYFCIVDIQQLGLYWHWGQKWALPLRFTTTHNALKYGSEMCLDFTDWLYIWQGGEELHLPEEVWNQLEYGRDVLL